MTYVVTGICVNCKHTDCVMVCPVDCFYEGKNTLVIHPDECIDCGVCVAECPIDAIVPDYDERCTPEVLEANTKYSQAGWPVITEKKDPMPGHETAKEVDDISQINPVSGGDS